MGAIRGGLVLRAGKREVPGLGADGGRDEGGDIMSYWVSINDKNGNALPVAAHEEGGTYVMGGSSEAKLNITYNYADQFSKVNLDFGEGRTEGRNGATSVHGKRAGDLKPQLRYAVRTLGTKRDTNYWNSTPGNAGYALSILLAWAEQHPDGIFECS